MVLSLQKFFR